MLFKSLFKPQIKHVLQGWQLLVINYPRLKPWSRKGPRLSLYFFTSNHFLVAKRLIYIFCYGYNYNFVLYWKFLDKQHYLVETLARCATCTTDLYKRKKIKRTNQQTLADMPNWCTKKKRNKPTDSCWHAKLRRHWRYINVIPKIHHSWTIFAKNSKIYGNSAVTKE